MISQFVPAPVGFWLKSNTGAYRRIVAFEIEPGKQAWPITIDDECEVRYSPSDYLP